MKIKLFICLFVSFTNTLVYGNSQIINQGSIEVTLQDLDGYAYKIPDEHRGDYFDSIQRLEKSLFSILNMKHIVKYGKAQGYVDDKKVEVAVNDRLLKYFPDSAYAYNFNLEQENKIVLVRNFLKQEEAYKQIQKKLRQSIDESDLLELAKEKYMVNKSQYVEEEERTLDFISIVYNKNNRKQQGQLVKKLIEQIGDSTETFKEIHQKYHNNEANVETHKDIKFKFNPKDPEYSKKIFSIDEPGVLPLVIDYNSRFMLTLVTDIKKERIKSFDEVKDGFIEDIRQKSAERKFNTLLISLTKDEVEINQEILPELKSRYYSKGK